MDKIIISGLNVQTIIGTLESERAMRQGLILDTELFGDFRVAGESDDFNYTFDYSRVEEALKSFVEKSHFSLLEALAEQLCAHILRLDCRIHGIRLHIVKPGAARYARSIAIEIARGQTA